jgi:hypothetical protein
MFADVTHGFVFTVMLDEQRGVAVEDFANAAECRADRNRLAAQRGRQFGDQPWTAETPASDNYAVTAGSGHHP